MVYHDRDINNESIEECKIIMSNVIAALKIILDIRAQHCTFPYLSRFDFTKLALDLDLIGDWESQDKMDKIFMTS